MSDRPADIVSPVMDAALGPKVSPADARAAGRFGYDKPTPETSVVLLVDHEIGLMVGCATIRHRRSHWSASASSLAASTGGLSGEVPWRRWIMVTCRQD